MGYYINFSTKPNNDYNDYIEYFIEKKPYPKRIQLRKKLMEIMAGYDNEHAAILIAEFIANNYRRRRK